MALIPCKDCGREISLGALSCPHCGRPKRQWPIGWMIRVIFFLAAALFLYKVVMPIFDRLLARLNSLPIR